MVGNASIDLTGNRFGRLIAMRRTGAQDKSKSWRWLCRCDCGNTHDVSAGNLRSGAVQSCGCLTRQRSLVCRKHPELNGERYPSGPCVGCVKEIRERNREQDREKRRVREQTPEHRAMVNEWQNARRKKHIQVRLRHALAQRVLAACRGAKSARTMKLIGCSIEFLMGYLEAMFIPGMTWENHAIDGWHIDHVIPCARFDLSDPMQQLACFHYTNLQPLWAVDNLRKQAK